MTREEAIEELKCSIELTHFNPLTGETSEWLNEDNQRYVDAAKMAIEALETLNSHTVDLTVAKVEKHMVDLSDFLKEEQEVAHWQNNGEGDGFIKWNCSECGMLVRNSQRPWYKFCPSCGAKMESEDEECG